MAELRMLTAQRRAPAGDYNIVSGASGALSGAATGASIGSVIPVIGTTVGAVVGAVVGLLGGFGDEPEDHTPFILAARAAKGYGWVQRGAAGTAEFRAMVLRGDPNAVALAQQSGLDVAAWTARKRAQLAKRAARGGGGTVSPPLTVQPVGPAIPLSAGPTFTVQPVGPAIPLSAGPTFAVAADDEAPPAIAALIAFLQQIVSLGGRA